MYKKYYCVKQLWHWMRRYEMSSLAQFPTHSHCRCRCRRRCRHSYYQYHVTWNLPPWIVANHCEIIVVAAVRWLLSNQNRHRVLILVGWHHGYFSLFSATIRWHGTFRTTSFRG